MDSRHPSWSLDRLTRKPTKARRGAEVCLGYAASETCPIPSPCPVRRCRGAGADAGERRWGYTPPLADLSFFSAIFVKSEKGLPQNKVDEIQGVLYFGGRLVCTLTFASPTENPVLPTQRQKGPIPGIEASFSFLVGKENNLRPN